MTVSMTKSSASPTAEQIAEARDWIADAYPQSAYDMSDTHPVYEESAERVQSFTDRRYPGGWAAFVADCCTYVQQGCQLCRLVGHGPEVPCRP